MKTKDEVIVDAINSMKRGQFKLTGIKVELEAVFNRGGYDVCGECSDGEVTCWDCDGEGHSYCNNDECEEGNVRNGQEFVTCSECEGAHQINCEECDEGYRTCEECGGKTSDFGNEDHCQQWLLERLEQHGLSEQVDGMWRAKAPLVFMHFYRDPSVDSEVTFTMSMDNPENVYKIPKVIEAWNELGEAIGNGVDVRGAGMHIALLNNPDCYYSSGQSLNDDRQFERSKNFQKSMTLLMPALFFLSSNNEKSRPLRFRAPKVGIGDKYSAVHYDHNALEFRVFETCYERPEAILDNIVVIKNCMRYWTTKYTRNRLQNIANNIRFGVERGDTLERFYITREHIKLLNAGLKLLKPSYYTIREVKNQRKFARTVHKVNAEEKSVEKKAHEEYKEYEERFGWHLVIRRQYAVENFLQRHMDENAGRLVEFNREEVMKDAEKKAEEEEQNYKKGSFKDTKTFVKDKINEMLNRSVGDHRLVVEE